jgi:hypothetical protein
MRHRATSGAAIWPDAAQRADTISAPATTDFAGAYVVVSNRRHRLQGKAAALAAEYCKERIILLGFN